MGSSAIPRVGVHLQEVRSQVESYAARWLTAAADEKPWLLQVPDIGVACEVLLADRLFCDLSADERSGLYRWIRANQDPSGAWLGLRGQPDLSLTAMGWWACVEFGDDPQSEHLVRARRVVHELGGAQRANFSVRIWLAMAGAIPWSWLPSMPAELWLLPASTPVSPHRIAPWARGLMTPFLLLAQGDARVHLSDPTPLLLCRTGGELVAPRVTSPGAAGDLLQIFDRTLKLINKVPRGPLSRRAKARARAWLRDSQQHHGGWFSARPTLLTLVAMRCMGMTFDAPEIRRGLDYLRRSRGYMRMHRGPHKGEVFLAQGLGSGPVSVQADLLASADAGARRDALDGLLVHEIREAGAWQLRTDAPAGGWPHEFGAQAYLDVEATCAVLGVLGIALRDGPQTSVRTREIWAAIRRGCQVILAMQEADGSFSRFERGESNVWMSRLPWRDAVLLSAGERFAAERIRVTAKVLLRLNQFGWRRDDDRIARGLQWLGMRTQRLGRFDTSTLALVTRCFAAHSGRSPHPQLPACEAALRARQHEDGSFGSLVDTAAGLRGLMALDGAPCIQAHRAGAFVARACKQHATDEPPDLGSRLHYGLGLSPICVEPARGVIDLVETLREIAGEPQMSMYIQRGEE